MADFAIPSLVLILVAVPIAAVLELARRHREGRARRGRWREAVDAADVPFVDVSASARRLEAGTGDFGGTRIGGLRASRGWKPDRPAGRVDSGGGGDGGD